MSRVLTATGLGLIAFFVASGPAISNERMTGSWSRSDGNARVSIEPCGADVCATNTWIGDTSGGEEVGDKLVMTLKPVNDTTFSGTAFDVKRDRTYAIEVGVDGDAMTTKGCIVGGLLCKAVNWTRNGAE